MINAKEIAREAAGDCYETWGTCHRSAAELREMWASFIRAAMQPLVEERDALAAEVADFLKAAAESGYTSNAEDVFRQVAQAVVSDAGSAKRLGAELRSSREIQAAEKQILVAEVEKNHRLEAAAGAMRKVLNETAARLDALLTRGDLSGDAEDERTTRRWLNRVRAALLPTAGAALLAQMAAMRAVARKLRGVMPPEVQAAHPELLREFQDAFHGTADEAVLSAQPQGKPVSNTDESAVTGQVEHSAGEALVEDARKLAADFLRLPYHRKLTIMRVLGILEPDERPSVFSPAAVWVECFKLAREKGKLAELRAAIDATVAAKENPDA